MRILLTSAALIVGLLGMGVSPALAAKGVKKETVDGVKHIHGVVIHVEHSSGKGKAKSTSGHLGEITVKVHHSKKKGQPAAVAGKPAVAANPAVAGTKKVKHHHKYSVSANTKFTFVKGKEHNPATFADVHEGEHVIIVEKKGHAEVVDIEQHVKKKAA